MNRDFYHPESLAAGAGIDPFMLKRATSVARSLVSIHGLRRDDFEDYRQELLLDAISRVRYFNPARGSWAGFITGVMRNRASELIRAEPKQWRETTDLPDGVLEKYSEASKDTAIHSKVDVEKILSDVPENLQQVAKHLRHNSVEEIASTTGKSRARVYQLIAQLKVEFTRRGFSSTRRLGHAKKRSPLEKFR